MTLPIGSRIGILGGGQLGRMMSMAAATLGYHVHIFTPEEDSPAAEVSRETTVAGYENEAALRRFAESVDVVTLEFENLPVRTLEIIADRIPVHPGAKVLDVTQHRIREKDFIRSCGVGTAPYQRVTNQASLADAANQLGYPAILKTCCMGYDGKGQTKLTQEADISSAWAALQGAEAVLEGFVSFTREISVIVARSASGEIVTYPVVANEHRNHILHETIVPSGQPTAIEDEARRIALTLAERIDLVGLLAVEMFVTGTGEVLVNELAPRPHNSGHWTMDAAATSQFEQAIRAVAGLPLGPTGALFPARMRNLIGEEADSALELFKATPEAKLHLYGKNESRPGRKMGHVTVRELSTVSPQ